MNARLGTQCCCQDFKLEKDESVRQGRASEPEAGSDRASDAACEDGARA